MITEQQKELVNWALQYALSQGCADARVELHYAGNNSFEYRDTQLDRLEQSVENGMNFHLYVDGRYALFTTNRIEKEELIPFIEKAIETTRYLTEDPFRRLPDPSRYYKDDGEDLELYDKAIQEVSVDEKLQLIKDSVNEVYGTDDRLISVQAAWSDGISASYVVNSRGFKGETLSSYFNHYADTVIQGKGDARPSASWYNTSPYWADLQKKGIATTAYERTLKKIGQEKIASGNYKMLLDNTQSARLLSPVIAAMMGSAIHQKTSFLMEKLGQQVFSEKMTLTDDPHIKRAQGARWFDGEGVATQKRTIIDHGLLTMYYLDTYYSAKLEMSPTIQSPSILCMEPGTQSHQEIMESLDNAIWITGFNGGNSNATTGDFSFGIEGFLIKEGKAIQPISEMNITGNIIELWNRLLEVGNDPRMTSSWRIPSLLFDEVAFSGGVS